MRERYIPAVIVLLAAAITEIINLVNKVDRRTALIRLLVVIIIFYIMGLIIRAVVTKVLIQGPKADSIEAEEIVETEELLEEVPMEE